jgi:hypothetical protein
LPLALRKWGIALSDRREADKQSSQIAFGQVHAGGSDFLEAD